MNPWKKKLAAWLHDPAEKALVLMRDTDNQGQRIGHEEGSVAELRRLLGIVHADFDKRADRYAAAADRPQWPCEDGRPRPAWANVRFADQPVLIHPLSGEEIDLDSLADVAAPHLRHASLDHFTQLIDTDERGEPDHRATLLAFWRFGPEPKLAAPELGELWRLLPADTRVPDHTIWSHLDVVSALAGAMNAGAMNDDTPALLTMSFGPVQGFIAQARSTSDLWAGSHLLSSLVWEGLKVVCEALGPDAMLFPQLRGVAAVDRWLLESAPAHRRDAWKARFEAIGAPWLKSATDANPLFAATLPNKFMALVPASRARDIAEQVTDAVRAKALEWAAQAAEKVFAEGGGNVAADAHWRGQIAGQLRGFPEVHWSVADWPTATDADGFPDSASLEATLAAFYPEDAAAPGFFADPLWRLVAGGDVVTTPGKKRVFKKLVVEGGQAFFVPNPGLLYPAVHDLAERGLAAGKTLRGFDALAQQGYRCTLTSEHEWLTDDAAQLHGHDKDQSGVWNRVVGRFGIKAGERLGALGTLKRLWPTLFVEQVRGLLEGDASRYVVSTHTMALARDLEALAGKLADASSAARMLALLEDADRAPVLPRSLATLRSSLAARVPAALDRLREGGGDERRRLLEDELDHILGHKPETYYALIQMDGDRMGAWMAGNETDYQRRFADTWHPQVRAAVRQKFGGDADLARYLDAHRPASPARHAAISGVLNDFSTHVARHVVEDVFKGKLLYAGGDDVLAMVSVDDLLPAMLLLRAAYSGVGDFSGVPGSVDLKGLKLGRGFVHLRERLMLMMGSAATASIGAVVAHYQAPLAAVLRELRAAEQRAKAHGRNAFCLRVMKRGGGEIAVTSRFWEHASEPPLLADTALGLILRFAHALAQPEMSRRAVYHTTAWLAGLPPRSGKDDAGWQSLVATSLAYQLQRQGGEVRHARELVELACRESAPADTAAYLTNLLVSAEFFAREGRAFAAPLRHAKGTAA